MTPSLLTSKLRSLAERIKPTVWAPFLRGAADLIDKLTDRNAELERTEHMARTIVEAAPIVLNELKRLQAENATLKGELPTPDHVAADQSIVDAAAAIQPEAAAQ